MAKERFVLHFLVLLGVLTYRSRQEKRFCSPPSVYFTRRSQILCVQLDKMGKSLGAPLLIYTPEPNHFDFKYTLIPFALDVDRRTIYWMDARRKEINQMNLNDTSVVMAVDGLVGNVHSLALDWLSRNIYWTDTKNNWIGIASLQGGFSKVLVYEGISSPRGLAVDPVEGYIFWMDIGDSKRIERCLLDGTSRTTLVKTALTSPYDLSIDTVKNRLYWMERTQICSVNYRGSHRSCFLLNNMESLQSPYGLAFSSTLNLLYISDLVDHNTKSFDLLRNQSNNNVTSRYFYKDIFFEQLKMYESTTERKVSTPCLKSSKPCSHICFGINRTHFRCACPSGMRLLQDQKSCQDKDLDFGIYVADAQAGKIYRLSKFFNQSIFKIDALPNPSGRNSFPIAVAYDKEENIIFWSDYALKRVYRIHGNGTGYKPVAVTGFVEGLAFDHISRLIYWSNVHEGAITIARPDGSTQATIGKDIKGYLRDIALYPEKGILFYTAWHSYAKVGQMDMDGSNPTIIFDKSTSIKVFWPNGLALDREAGKLYCVDAFYKRIIFYDLNSKRSAVLFSRGGGPKSYLAYPTVDVTFMKKPFGLTLNKEYLYWTDWDSKAIHGLNRHEGHWEKTYLAGFNKPEDLQVFDLSKGDHFKHLNVISYSSQPCKTQCSDQSLAQITFDPCPAGYRLKRQRSGCYKTSYDPDLGVRTDCTDWVSCSLRLEHTMPCQSVGVQFVHVGVRQCVQTLKYGYCPSVSVKDCQTRQACNADQECPGTEKCCANACGKTCSVPSLQPVYLHPCQTTYKACNICVSLPNNKHRCLCPTGLYLASDGITCQRGKDICARHSCQNKGTCKLINDNPSCFCLPGFTGSFCETSLVCASNPCLHGATCMPLGSDYLCHCSNYTEGKNCELQKECGVNVCLHQGKCRYNLSGQTVCSCLEDYEGKHCETRTKCNGYICHNNGTCHGSGADSRCVCYPGYTGPACLARNSCFSSPCINGGSCNETDGSFLCTCPNGYFGKRCENSSSCQKFACQNNGKCVWDGSSFWCQCPQGFSGKFCENRLYCFPLLCKNNGTCIETGDSFRCQCHPDYTGDVCETRLPCADITCLHDGTCQGQGLSYKCLCAQNYTGKHCETKLPCTESPCHNHGICVNSFGNNFTCKCFPGYTGRHCEIELLCADIKCEHNATCVKKASGYECACNPGYSGSRCENPLYCSSNPCVNNGKCEEENFGYACKCLPGFNGRNCEQSLLCSGILCQNNGTCVAEQHDGIEFHCQCTSSFTGAHCETKLYCPGLSCKNNGSCVESGPLSYCDCRPDYTGKDCSSKVNNCANNKCQNKAECLNDINSYSCKCRTGYSGEFCETHRCRPNPCQNNGRCQMGSSSICDCLTYYIGEYCDIYIGNNVLSTTLKSTQGTRITVHNFKVVIAKLYTEFCSQGARQRNDPCSEIGGVGNRGRREASHMKLAFSPDNIYVLKGFPKLLEDGSQQFEYTVLVPQGDTRDSGQTLASLDFIEKGFIALRNFTERELKAIIFTVKRYQTNDKDVLHSSTPKNNSLAIWLPIVIIIVLIALGSSVALICKRKRNRQVAGHDSGNGKEFMNPIYCDVNEYDVTESN